jgi:hypothetical protein
MTGLKIIVERAVRPVQASKSHKRKFREELLAHVVGIFEEELARLGDERAAVERTARRFGNPAEVTRQLEESVPARDAVRRYWEGRPGELAWRTAMRFAWVSGTFALVFVVFFLAVALSTAGSVGAWPREVWLPSVCAVLTIPAWLSCLVLLSSFMERALYGPEGRSRLKVARLVAGSSPFVLLWLAAWRWPIGSASWLVVFLIVGLHSCVLADASVLRRRYLEEWARLPIDIPS